MALPVPVVRLDPDLPLPTYAHPGDAGLDLHAREDAHIPAGGGRALHRPGGYAPPDPIRVFGRIRVFGAGATRTKPSDASKPSDGEGGSS